MANLLATIERLNPGEAERFRTVRLRALQDTPDAFATTFDDAAQRSPEQWAAQLQTGATFVAVLDSHDIGLVRGAPSYDDPRAAYLISMWVAPTARRNGVGASLIAGVAQWAEKAGFQTLLLDVSDFNALAISLYSRAGFVRTGKSGTLPPPRQHIGEFQMALDLARSERSEPRR